VPTISPAFISHSSKDAALARQLCEALETNGIPCWIAPRDIPTGRSWADSVVEGLEGCAAFVLLATANSVASEEVLTEIESARRLTRQIFTVMVDGPRLSGEITYYLTRLQWLESGSGTISQAGARLADVLRGTKRWEAVATPPSLGRRLRSTIPYFSASLAAVLIAILLLGAIGWYAFNRTRKAVATDYRSIGWTTLDQEPLRQASASLAVGHVWLGDADMPFSKVGLLVRLSTAQNGSHSLDLSSQLPANGTSEAEFDLPLPADANSLATFLLVPKGSELFCVRQSFVLQSGRLRPDGEAKAASVANLGACS
jgi:hypothetical protein